MIKPEHVKQIQEEFLKEQQLDEMFDFDTSDGSFRIKLYKEDVLEVPHFHIKDLETKKEAVICLKQAYYLGHEDEVNDHFSKETLQVLQNWMEQSDDYTGEVSNYQLLIILWNMNNLNQISVKQKIPNYVSLAD